MAGLALLFLAPEAAHAWGPGTHTFLSLEVLGSLNLLPGAVASLLAGRGLEFLYGALAADIPVGKRYAPDRRHPHAWPAAREMMRGAGEDSALRAAALGYASHLAADVVAHRSFVPRMLLLTSSTQGVGHSYWEHRTDAAVGAESARAARAAVSSFDHARIDELLDRTLDRTLFSFRTNRRIFRGMVRIADDERWQLVFDTVVENSRWDLTEGEIGLYLREAFQHVIDHLQRGEGSWAAAADPTGREDLRRAKQIRRRVLADERPYSGKALRAAADRHYALPSPGRGAWQRRGDTSHVSEALRGRLLGRSSSRAAG